MKAYPSLGWRDKIFGSDSTKDEPEVEEEDLTPLLDSVRTHLGNPIREIAFDVGVEKSMRVEDAARDLYRLSSGGLIRFVDPSPPSGFLGYAFSLYGLWFWVLAGFMALVTYSVFLMPQVYPFVYLRYLVGAVFVLYVPGYVLIQALYPKAAELERLERFGLGVGLSLALVPLVGLVLNYTPWGIRLEPVFASLILLTLALGLYAVYRKYGYWLMRPRA
ncbi:MAG: DUF1616 domain-containing protein [Candidatus Bathyarchaeota archaeon]|nr:DUF1616 domain-containing protein [Candidatus Bathyarchaeota archaeon]